LGFGGQKKKEAFPHSKGRNADEKEDTHAVKGGETAKTSHRQSSRRRNPARGRRGGRKSGKGKKKYVEQVKKEIEGARIAGRTNTAKEKACRMEPRKRISVHKARNRRQERKVRMKTKKLEEELGWGGGGREVGRKRLIVKKYTPNPRKRGSETQYLERKKKTSQRGGGKEGDKKTTYPCAKGGKEECPRKHQLLATNKKCLFMKETEACPLRKEAQFWGKKKTVIFLDHNARKGKMRDQRGKRKERTTRRKRKKPRPARDGRKSEKSEAAELVPPQNASSRSTREKRGDRARRKEKPCREKKKKINEGIYVP